MKTLDCIVVGGGAAGAVTSLCLARQGFRVALAERSDYESWRVGEVLPPRVAWLLRELGLWEAFSAQKFLPSEFVESAWSDSEPALTHFIFSPYGNGWHIDRRRFDEMLALEAAKDGCKLIRPARFLSASRLNGGWEVVLQEKGKLIQLRASVLVDATGRSAAVVRNLGGKRIAVDKLTGWVGLMRQASGAHAPSSALTLEAVENGWWYSAPLPDSRLVVAYLTDSNLEQGHSEEVTSRWLSGLENTGLIRSKTMGFALEQPLQVRPAETARMDEMAGPGWFAVGDAAFGMDPLSGNGVMKAMQSGMDAARFIEEYLHGNKLAAAEYDHRLAIDFENCLEKQKAYYAMENRWADNPFWQRRQISSGMKRFNHERTT